MKKLVLASVSALALFGVAACSDTDSTTTQSVEEPAAVETAPANPPATDNTTTQSVEPDNGMNNDASGGSVEPAPAPAPAQ